MNKKLLALLLGICTLGLALDGTAQDRERERERERQRDRETAAYRDGFDKGFKEGYDKAYKEGYDKAYKEAFDAGYRKAQLELAPPPQVVVVPAPPPLRNFLIDITNANYGPDGGGGPRCDAMRYVRKEAHGRRTATVSITNDMCGDPAPGKRKSIEITYRCGPLVKVATAYEHRSAYLECE